MLSADEFWKYAGVFGALVAAGFGAPIPEELPIATGGVLVGRDWNNPDGLKWWIMLPVCILGVVLCDTFLYFVGRRWGRKLISLKWVQRRLMSPERFKKIEKNFHDYGIRILLITRILPGIRTPVFLTAGIVHLPFRKFLLADALYAIPGVCLFFWLAYWLTDTFLALLHKVESYRELAVIAILSFFAGFITATFVRRPVTTGSPEELPVLGKPVVTIANPQMPEVKHGDTPILDGRAHVPSVNGSVTPTEKKPETTSSTPVSM
ncbi:MAG TPA: DedA family protein [Gemmataceae bacterium]|jgi:membrane protein DedA with SNARE-associated domain|nr:DedA family protein [Gemmataceae bacterium]